MALAMVVALAVVVAAGVYSYDALDRRADESRAARAAEEKASADAAERLRSGIERSRAQNAAEAIGRDVCAARTNPCSTDVVRWRDDGVYEAIVSSPLDLPDPDALVCIRVFVNSGLSADASDWPAEGERWERC